MISARTRLDTQSGIMSCFLNNSSVGNTERYCLKIIENHNGRLLLSTNNKSYNVPVALITDRSIVPQDNLIFITLDKHSCEYGRLTTFIMQKAPAGFKRCYVPYRTMDAMHAADPLHKEILLRDGYIKPYLRELIDKYHLYKQDDFVCDIPIMCNAVKRKDLVYSLLAYANTDLTLYRDDAIMAAYRTRLQDYYDRGCPQFFTPVKRKVA